MYTKSWFKISLLGVDLHALRATRCALFYSTSEKV